MKRIILPLLILSFTYCCAQQHDEAEKKAITEKVNLFFKVLETKDTALYKTLVYSDAQIWTIRPVKDTLKIASRSFSTDIANLAAMKTVIEERPISLDIKVHNNIAVVWAPYTLSISGKFSHCGVDIFTLLKAPEGWKIVSTVYSVEPDGCASLKQN
jgi:hypothetical protein